MSVVVLLLFLFMVVPVSNFLHEMGHMSGAIAVKAEQLDIFVGSGRPIWHHHFGRLTITVHLIFFIGASAQQIRNRPFMPLEKMWISLCGPLMNVLVSVTGFVLLQWASVYMIEWFIFYNVWLACVNLFPFKIRGKPSDGFIVLANLFKKQVQ